jgi:hypothetical protein
MGTGPLARVGTPGQKAVTRALAKFCREHGHAPAWVQELEQFAEALEKRDVYALKVAIRRFTHAGMGSFIDWFPSPSFPNEDEEYVECVWHALYGHWHEQVSPITKVEHVV